MCVQPVLHCSETWESVADEMKLRVRGGVERRMMIICCTRPVDRASSANLRQRVVIDRATEELINQNCLRWYGHEMDNPIWCYMLMQEGNNHSEDQKRRG